MFIWDTTPPKCLHNPRSNHRKWANPWKMGRNNVIYRRLGKIYNIKPKRKLMSHKTHRQTNKGNAEIPVHCKFRI